MINPLFKTLLLAIALLFSFETANCQEIQKIEENYLNRLLENYKKQASRSFHKGRYLIITPSGFEQTLEYFANYKRNIGFDVQIVNTKTIGKTSKLIKTYIQNQYNKTSTRPDYILLVGDVDSIPAHSGNSSGKVKTDPINDLGYALLEGKDFLADVFIGRFSVANVEELKNIINKTIFMEVNLHLFEKNATFLAGDEKKGVWNRTYMKNSFKNGHEAAISNGFIPLGYNCQRLYQPNKTAAIKALSDNTLFFSYAGHGTFFTLAGKSFEIGNKEILAATNTVFPFVFSFSCKTGCFTQTSIGEYFIRAKNKGGVAFFGASVNSHTNTDIIIQKRIFGDAFTQNIRQLSPMINQGMRQFASAVGIRKKIKEMFLKAYNLLGDPSLDIRGLFASTKNNDRIINPALFSVFSNPLKNDFSLAYTLEKESIVQIDIYNTLGEHVKNIIQLSKQKSGVYYYNFSLKDLPSGVYELVYKDSSQSMATQVKIE